MKTTTNGKAKKKVAKKAPTNRIGELPPNVIIQPLNIGRATFDIVGTSPLVTHPFGKKSELEMLEKQMGTKKKAGKNPRCPKEEFLDAFYWVDGEAPPHDKIEDGVKVYHDKTMANAIKNGTFGIPLTAFKNAIISTGRNTGMKMTSIRQTLFVKGDHPEYAIVHGTPQMDERIVRISNNTPMVRFRPMWVEWSTRIHIEFDRNQLSPDQVANMVNVAGYYVGVCEGRPEKAALGWGRFQIVGS